MTSPRLSVPGRAALVLAIAGAWIAPAHAQHAAAGGQGKEATRVIVAFKPGASGAVRAAIAAARGHIKHDVYGMDAVAIEVPPQALAGLMRNPNVLDVEPDEKRYPLAGSTPTTGTPYATGQLMPYGIRMVQADQMTQVSVNRTICIIDSGYARGHEDLPSGTNITGSNDVGTGNWYTDENHHGTHVAGTIAALNNSGKGVVGVISNNSLRLHIVKVFDAEGWAYSSTLATAANKCRDAGANIISMSLGGERSSKTEQKAFDLLATNNNILSIAAAGNDGNTRSSYPAGYESVVSVAAIDENKQWATFSQYNRKVELAAPGVNVLSTVPMNAGNASALSVGGTTYAPGGMDGSPRGTASGPLADFGLGGTATPGSMTGKVCLIQRGTYDFSVKVKNCQDSGGVGAVVYNNVAGSFGGTLGTTVTAIPSVTASDTEGASLKLKLDQAATLSVTPTSYAFYDGTSMATPHVSAVAALVWAAHPQCTAAQLRTSLGLSAEDLGVAGRDTKYGFGLVRAKAAVDRISQMSCGK